MIVCSCNVLTEAQILDSLKREDAVILDSLKREDAVRPRSAAQAYRCLGCAPRCGRCVQTVRALVERAHLENCKVGCPSCPAQHEAAAAEPAEPYLIAAE